MNNLQDLNNYLFEQLERLNEVDKDNMIDEIKRAQAISGVADRVIDNGKLALEVEKFKDEKMDPRSELPKMLGE